MAAIDQTLISVLLNYLTPTGAAGVNGTAIGTPLGTTAMKLRLNSTLSTAAAAGTEIGNGFRELCGITIKLLDDAGLAGFHVG